MEEKTETVKVEVAIEYNPSFVVKIVCPYCNTPQEDDLTEAEANRILLHSCQSCEQDFYIDIPNFPPLK